MEPINSSTASSILHLHKLRSIWIAWKTEITIQKVMGYLEIEEANAFNTLQIVLADCKALYQ